MDIMTIVGSVIGLAVAVIGFFIKRELSRIDGDVGNLIKRLDSINTRLADHEQKIARNADKDGADYKMISTELDRIKKDMDKDITNISAIMDTKIVLVDTKLTAMQATLERILNKLDEADKQRIKLNN